MVETAGLGDRPDGVVREDLGSDERSVDDVVEQALPPVEVAWGLRLAGPPEAGQPQGFSSG
ncbi:MAG TPA: hypothetical protein VFG33_39265 [Kribbella sp.]|uniref:hypothetical protein n=1 Tax=Kribbella sp. TaxID=1871183 RepID=UPI002D795D1E|nr:hypothetical protein [Kribbella sp.]HET6299471.1 hypothetical protein [Kribbella sp.]